MIRSTGHGITKNESSYGNVIWWTGVTVLKGWSRLATLLKILLFRTFISEF